MYKPIETDLIKPLDYLEYAAAERVFNSPTLEVVPLSLNAGRRIFVHHAGGTIYKVTSKYGSGICDTFKFFRLPDGRFATSTSYIFSDAQIKLNSVMRELIEAGTLAEAVLHFGQKSVCCICGANLTDPVSISRGIGPECVKKIHAQSILKMLGWN